jgi:exodeoxyribonuclease VII small subunit
MESNTPQNLLFEQSLQQLEQRVKMLEEGNLPLEEALSTFEEGIKLTRTCQQALANAEQKVEQLTHSSDDSRAPACPTDS